MLQNISSVSDQEKKKKKKNQGHLSTALITGGIVQFVWYKGIQ